MWLLVCQDHGIKVCILMLIPDKAAKTVAKKLLFMFTLLGAPAILQSDNGREFVNAVIDELKLLWPELKQVNVCHAILNPKEA